MKLKPYKNKYKHDVVDCPFCSYFAYVRPSTKVSPDPLRDLKRHITNAAKNEALSLMLDAGSPRQHLDYFIAHTKMAPVVKALKRQYDNDLTI